MASVNDQAEIRTLFDRHEQADQERHESVIRELALMRMAMETLNGTVTAVEAELGGAPKLSLRKARKSVQERLHELENDRAAATVAQAALEAARAVRNSTWSVWQKIGLFLFAGAAAAASILRVLGVGG